MKKLLALLIFCTAGFAADAQSSNPTYNKTLADSLGADDYGMKSYVLVVLKTGTAKITDQARVSELFRGHMDNIGKMAEAGKLVVAGPLGKNDKAYRGIFILDVKTLDEAKALLQTDPAVKAKLLDAELYEWYGSAALPVYLPVHGQIEKIRP
ncbi:YciI family protein [Pontibacter oryzae]|uniref:YCII-related domain-containing protein n=1 Tax=Pontibacter oryzae TaxID=2304593 RepID=A0A399RSU5_9BACT|nr:YciI family protein [Pontibacter oryzae]RIJ33413.1 hypothetical protein D1627_17490 [Pontibacter oryzae]